MDDDQYTAAGPVGGNDDLQWIEQPATEDGGIAIAGITRRAARLGRDPVWWMVFSPLADGTQGGTLRAAAAAAKAQDSRNLDLEGAKGYGLSFVHMRFAQPPFGDSPGVERIAGPERTLIWDEDSDGPNVEFVYRGKHLRLPTRGLAHADFPVLYTPNWSAANLWFENVYKGVPLRNIVMPSFIEAAEISDTEIRVDAGNDLCNLRIAYLGTADDDRPAQLAGNEYPPRGAFTTRGAAAAAAGGSPVLWFALSWRIDGAWLPWGPWTRIGRASASGVVRNGVGLALTRSTGGSGPTRSVSLSVEPMGIVQAFGAPDPGDIDPFPDDDDDQPDPGPGLPGNPSGDVDGDLPVSIDDWERYCRQFDQDKTAKLYEVNGLISSDDDLDTIRRELDLAGNGAVVVDGGRLYAMPGWDRDPVAHIDATDPDVQMISYRGSPPLADRLNAGSLRLANSRVHHFQPYTTRQIIDTAQRIEDGELIHRDLGTRAFGTSPVAAEIHLRQKLAELRPWKVVAYRLPLEYSPALRRAVPGQRVTLNAPEIDLNPVVNRDEAGALFGFGNALGRYMRLLGREFNFDDDLTMTVVLTEHPDGVYAPRAAFPGMEPDPTAPGAFVDKPTGLSVSEQVYVDRAGNTVSRIVGTSDLAAVAERIVQFRPVIPGGIAPDTYRELVVQNGEGDDVTLTETPDWGGARQFSIDGSGFTIENRRIGVTYEVRLIDRSRYGVDSEPSDAATITMRGNRGAPPTPTGLAAQGILNGWYQTIDEPPVTDIRNWEVYASTDTDKSEPSPTDLVGSPRSPEFVLSSLELAGDQIEYEEHRIWIRARDKSDLYSGYATALVTPLSRIEGARGEDGQGYEYAFAKSAAATVPADQRPLDEWGFDILHGNPIDVNGTEWHDGAGTINLDPAEPFLLRCLRRPVGTPARGAAVEDEWGAPSVVGHYGQSAPPGVTNLSAALSRTGSAASGYQGTGIVSLDYPPGLSRILIKRTRYWNTDRNPDIVTNIYRSTADGGNVNPDGGSFSALAIFRDPVAIPRFTELIDVEVTTETIIEGRAYLSGVVSVQAEGTGEQVLSAPRFHTTLAGDREVSGTYNRVADATGYDVEISADLQTWTRVASNQPGLAVNVSSIAGARLVNGRTYYLRARSRAVGVTSVWGEPSVGITPRAPAQRVAPGVPTNVRGATPVQSGNQFNMTLSFGPPASWGTGSTASRRFRPRSPTGRDAGLLREGSTSVTFYRLQPSTRYTAGVRCETDHGQSAYAEVTFTTPALPVDPGPQWGEWSSWAAYTPSVAADMGSAASETPNVIRAWDSRTRGLWNGAAQRGFFCVHYAGAPLNANIQVAQSRDSTGNNMKRLSDDVWFGTDVTYFNQSGNDLDRYRSDALSFTAAVRNTIRNRPGAAPPGSARALWFLTWDHRTNTQTLYAVTSNGMFRATRRWA